MKALTLWQPWASAIALGIKQYETRGWTTDYRGPLAIHAGRTSTVVNREFYFTEMTLGRLPEGGLPVGVVLCVVDLVEIVPTIEAELMIGPIEKLYGHYAPGRFAWKLDNLRVLAEPIPARGYQGLWEWPVGLSELTTRRHEE